MSVAPQVNEVELWARYRQALDAESAAAAAKTAASKAVEELEFTIRAHLEATGRWETGVAVKAGGVLVTVTEKARATYDPAKWGEIVAWAAQHGMAYLVQRRLNDKGVAELVESGHALPEGLGIEFHKEISFRRG